MMSISLIEPSLIGYPDTLAWALIEASSASSQHLFPTRAAFPLYFNHVLSLFPFRATLIRTRQWLSKTPSLTTVHVAL